jgi:hypothetical protein
MADDAIDPTRDQRMLGLDGYQPTEPVAEQKDRPDPQRATGREKNDAKPANNSKHPATTTAIAGLGAGALD